MLEAGERAGGRAGSGLGTWLGRAAAFALGVILLVGTAAKAMDPAAFAEMLRSEHLTLGLPPMLVAIVALAIEGSVGLALVLGIRRVWSLGAAAALLAVFLVVTGRAWWVAAHGGSATAGCGCFGNLVERSPAGAFLEDLLLLLPLLLLAFVARDRGPRLPARRLAVVAVGACAIVLVAWRAPELPLDDWATRVRPGTEVANVCSGSDPRVCLSDVDAGLAHGRTWVVLADLAQPQSFVDPLNALVAGSPDLGVHVLTAAPSAEVKAFTWQWGPSFELHEAPAPLLRPLYRTLPRSFLVADGRVVRTVSGLPPGASASPGDPSK